MATRDFLVQPYTTNTLLCHFLCHVYKLCLNLECCHFDSGARKASPLQKCIYECTSTHIFVCVCQGEREQARESTRMCVLSPAEQ